MPTKFKNTCPICDGDAGVFTDKCDRCWHISFGVSGLDCLGPDRKKEALRRLGLAEVPMEELTDAT